MKKAWAFTQNVYRFDHSHFDEDFDNCFMLTNELIRNNQLDDRDREFYKQFRQKRKLDGEKRRDKQLQAYIRYATAKRVRFD